MIGSVIGVALTMTPLPGDYIYRCDALQLVPVENVTESKGLVLQNDADKWQFDSAFAKLTGVTEATDDLSDDQTMLRGTLPSQANAEFIAYLESSEEQDDLYILDWKMIIPATANQDTKLLRSGTARCKFEMFGLEQDSSK